MPTIYLDADACPVKEQVYRVAARYAMPLSVVANTRLRIPDIAGLNATLEVVPGSLDAADDWIANAAQPGDLENLTRADERAWLAQRADVLLYR